MRSSAFDNDAVDRRWVIVCALALLASHTVSAQEVAASVSPVTVRTAAEASAVVTYWTPERMATAVPLPNSVPIAPAAQAAALAVPSPAGPPGFRNGSPPTGVAATGVPVSILSPLGGDLISYASATQVYSEPASVSYPSAQTTQVYQGRYRTYPRSPIGKLFMTIEGTDYAGSACLVGYKYAVTAGHCVNKGDGTTAGWATNVLFCPSYDSDQGGPNPAVGCWAGTSLAASTAWTQSADSDMDIGVVILASSGTVITNYPGYALGWLGYAWNYPVGQNIMAWGYPAQDRLATSNNSYAHFQGGKIVLTAAEEAGYTISLGSGSFAPSKFIGTIQTPGCSGGPWVIRMGIPYYGQAATGYVNGVNSHTRCWDSACTDLYQEISSPQFIRSGTGNGVCVGTCGAVDTIDYALTNYP